MADHTEEETYSTIFTSLKHPARRKILRMLADRPKNFSRILEDMGISSSHLTYHLENLGDLVTKMDDGSYRLSTFGRAAVMTMKGVEETPDIKPKNNVMGSLKWKTVFAILMIAVILLSSLSYVQFMSLNTLSEENQNLVSDFDQLSANHERLLSWGISTENVVSFLQDVVQLDTSQYYAELERNTIEYREVLGGISEWLMTYRLTSDNSELVIDFRFRNNTLSRYNMDVIEGAPIYTQPQPTDVLEQAENILVRYQAYSGASYLDPMRNILHTVEPVNTEKIVNNIKFVMATEGNDAEISWTYTAEGIDFQSKGVTISIDNGVLETLTDGWYLFQIGSTEVNISLDEAMEIAENRLKTFSWSTVENGQIVEVKDFLVLDQPRTVQLLPHSRDKPLELIPCYYITFYLNKVYPGNINGIGVGTWADTGEVRDCQTLTID
jgi:hypothetical protein